MIPHRSLQFSYTVFLYTITEARERIHTGGAHKDHTRYSRKEKHHRTEE